MHIVAMNTPSDIDKMPTGIDGVDDISLGGFPRDRMTLVTGEAGSGKTILALQTLVNGARTWGEPGIFVAFEEHSRRVVSNAASFGWNLVKLEKQRLFFLDAKIPTVVVRAGQFDLIGLLDSLSAKAKQMKAKRIVFDSIDVMLSALNDPTAELMELNRLNDWITQSGMTGIMTAKVDANHEAIGTPYRYLPFMVDCQLMLHHRMTERVSLRSIRIIKYRGSPFAENEFPLLISPSGIAVATFKPSKRPAPIFATRVSSGVQRLDAMLNGGYYRGTVTLVTGSPGTAKTTLGGAFVQAACKRRERALYVSFDEEPGEIMRNLSSVGIHLGRHVRNDSLKMAALRTETNSAEGHMLTIQKLMEEHRATCIVIDPFSAIIKTEGPRSSLSAAEQLLRFAKAKGVTAVCTSLLMGNDSTAEAASLQISTIADTWIQLAYIARGGERNRTLTVVKSRGTNHSNQVRELLLGKNGVTLTDVYSAGGEVLLGTARWEKERARTIEAVRGRTERERKRRALEADLAEAEAKMQALRHALQTRNQELAALAEEEVGHGVQDAATTEALRNRRWGDRDTPRNRRGKNTP